VRYHVAGRDSDCHFDNRTIVKKLADFGEDLPGDAPPEGRALEA